MPSPSSDLIEVVSGNRPPVFRATSSDLEALYPWQVECGLVSRRTGRKLPGIPMGYCGPHGSGGIYMHDEYAWFQNGDIRNHNLILLGRIGHGKSSYVKSLVYRGAMFGYRNLVIDPKGEYGALVAAIPGAKEIVFGHRANVYINPLDRTLREEDRNELLTSMALIALARPVGADLNGTERSILWWAVQDAYRSAGRQDCPTLNDVVRRLYSPTEAMADGMHDTVQSIQAKSRELADAMQRYTERDLKGMFDQATTPDLLDEKPPPLTVLNCADIQGPAAAVMIMLINFITQVWWGTKSSENRIHRIFHDEAWNLSIYPGYVASIRSSFKLGSYRGVSNIIVVHHLSNLQRSSNSEAVMDLIADTDTKIVYTQAEDELQASAEALGFSDREMELNASLGVGEALHKIGKRPALLVQHTRWPEEIGLSETRHLLQGSDVDVAAL